MKKNGVSLIVLIITMVIMVILAAAIILSISNVDLVENANSAVFKTDIAAMKDELSAYISDQYAQSVGSYQPDILQANDEGIWYGSTQLEGTITDIIATMDENYKQKLFIQDGKLVANKLTITVEEEKWLNDIGVESAYKIDIGKIDITPSTKDWINGNVTLTISYTKETPEGYVIQYRVNEGIWLEGNEVVVEENNTKVTARLYSSEKDNEAVSNSYTVSNIDKEVPDITAMKIDITAGTNSVTATASGATDALSGNVTYKYSIDNATWQTSGTFSGYKNATEVTVYAKAIDKVGNESASISDKETTTTPTISGLTLDLAGTYTNDYFKDSVIPKITYTSISSTDYVLQYKLASGSWTTVTSGTTLSEITTNSLNIAFRLYNLSEKDEVTTGVTLTKTINGGSSATVDSYQTVIANIDTDTPSKPTTLDLTVKDNTITATASGSTDGISGVLKYQYSKNNSTWQDSGTFTGLDSITDYTIYARAVDKVGHISETVSDSVTTGAPIISGSNTTIRDGNFEYNNPVIPVGFRALETNDATWKDTNSDGNPDGWDNGLVIQDASGNEFVWVPCTTTSEDGTVTYKNRFDEYVKKQSSLTGVIDDTEALPMNNDGTARITETEQIAYYGGFYVGRYEAGVPANQTTIDGTSADTSDTTGIPVVKQGATAWTFISYPTAVANSMSFINTTNVKSGLITGTQWDTMCAWIASSGIDVSEDSTSWGNYINSTSPANVDGYGEKQVTGYSEYWKAKNIYDVAGNAYEFSSELNASDTDKPINRGSRYANNGITTPATYRYGGNVSSKSTVSLGFRIVLYVNVPTALETRVTTVGAIATNANSSLTGDGFAYSNPVIPVGFKAINTDEASWTDTTGDGKIDGWNDGLVIQDESGNEFVWVPVDETNVTYAKWCTTGSSYANRLDDATAIPVSDESTQITKYGGFYIGRYESGVPADQTSIDGTSADTSNKEGKPVVQKGATVWTYISYTNAKANALAFCETDNVKSGLVTGTQWDTAMKWIKNAGISVTNSTTWGNYKDSVSPANVTGYGSQQTAGYSEYWKAKNIYDLAGNIGEWTGEVTSTFSTYRGGYCSLSGYYYGSGVGFPASVRGSFDPSDANSVVSFRLTLYVM